eukprot:CAMPEP_0194262270 /NCGR_PEP_ID=MMETSP0158-20130606/46458_1 /TAXON_ID=33649 /ORGANISM="Thalassionema nitzschioides, Strain L26-B" /LENGTH=418 /DNA_ID=CAMNT_0039002423 /DNA_START=37 /DNA_END=1289 /DNA_ORIENTATION=-
MMVLSLIAILSLSIDHPWFHQANNLLRKKVDNSINNNRTSSSMKIDIDNLYYNRTGPRIAFIAYTYMGNMTKFEARVIGALETFMKKEPIYFVVMSNMWNETYRTFCRQAKNRRHCQKLQIIWVDCGEGWSTTAGCCKAQKGLLQIYDQYGTNFDYFIYQDDDDYIRVDMLKRLLRPLPADEEFVVGSTELGYSLWDKYYCSDKEDFKYPWAQPIIYSRGSLKVISNGFRLNGLLSECVAYKLLYDVGLPIFNWMYSLPALMITLSDHYTHSYSREITQEEEGVFGYHGVLNDHTSGHAASFYTMQKAHEYYQTELDEPTELTYKWHNATGFRSTRTHSIHGDPRTWEDAWMISDNRECKPVDDDGEEAWKKKKEEEEERKRQEKEQEAKKKKEEEEERKRQEEEQEAKKKKEEEQER